MTGSWAPSEDGVHSPHGPPPPTSETLKSASGHGDRVIRPSGRQGVAL